MALDGNNLVAYDRNHRAHDIAVGAYLCRSKALRRTYPRMFPGPERVGMPFVRHSDELEYEGN